MIRQLGLKRVITLLSILAVLGVVYFYGILTLGPQTNGLDSKLRSEKSEFSTLSDNLINLRTGIEKFDLQKDKFKNLQTLGFFDAQNRVEITRRLNEMQLESGLISSQYAISPAITDKNEKATEAGYKILNTKIEFNLEAILDEEIYKFVYLLNYGFPGHVTIESLDIIKEKEVTPTLLQKIGSGDSIPVISARLQINLRTLVNDPTANVSTNEEGGY